LVSGKASAFELPAAVHAIPRTLKRCKVMESQLSDHYDIHLSELLEENQHLKERLAYLEGIYKKNRNTINILRDALGKTAFTPAIQISHTELAEIMVDLKKFAVQLLAMTQKGKIEVCIFEVDQNENVIGLEQAEGQTNLINYQ
jgi:hypothetical protein